MDAGETAEAAARRELWEETAIDGEGLLAVARYSAINAYGGSIFYVVFSATEAVIPVVVDPERKQTFFWFQAKEIPVADFYPADINFMEKDLFEHV